jgi:hypothetical protein
MVTMRKLFSNESVEDLEKENLGLEGKSLHLCTIKSPILGRFTSAKATVTMRI